MKINIYIYNRRKELNLSMKQIATIVGVSEATVSRWESGDIKNMKRDKLFLLAEALKISPLELNTDVISYEEKSLIKQVIIKKIEFLTDEQLEKLDNFIEQIIK